MTTKINILAMGIMAIALIAGFAIAKDMTASTSSTADSQYAAAVHESAKSGCPHQAMVQRSLDSGCTRDQVGAAAACPALNKTDAKSAQEREILRKSA